MLPQVAEGLLADDEDTRRQAYRALVAIGWDAVSVEAVRLARSEDGRAAWNVVDALAVVSGSPPMVETLERIGGAASGDLRFRAFALAERKRLGMDRDRLAAVFRRRGSPLELQRGLGSGLVCDAYLATHRETGLSHVVRVLSPSLAIDPQVRARFMDAMRRSVRYVHENLAVTRDVDQFPDDRIYFSWRDYVEGYTLQRLLDSHGRIEPERARRVAIAIVRGISPIHEDDHAHGGIIHRTS